MKYIIIGFIRCYQLIPGKWHNYCRFQPSCSNYAIGVFTKFNFFNACWLTIKRVCKCNPYSIGGYDPIPSKKNNF